MAQKRREIEAWNLAGITAAMLNSNPFRTGRAISAADLVPASMRSTRPQKPLFDVLKSKAALWQASDRWRGGGLNRPHTFGGIAPAPAIQT